MLTAELVSVTSGAVPLEAGDDYSTNPDVSADGRYVAFQSHAGNLVDDVPDTNETQDVFVRDLETGTTTLISVNFEGTASARSEGSAAAPAVTAGSFHPAISNDGRYIAFVSNAVDLVKGIEVDVVPNVFVRDRDADEDGVFDETGPGETMTRLLSLAEDGTAAGVIGGSGASSRPVISGDGKFVAFASFASDVDISGGVTDTNGSGGDVFRANVETGEIEAISVAADGTTTGIGSSSTVFDLSISETGDVVAFATTRSTLVTGAGSGITDTNALSDVFFGEGDAAVTLISTSSDGTSTSNGASREPVVSADGRHISFFSSGTDITDSEDSNGTEDLFVYDRKTGESTLISRSRETTDPVAADGGTPGGSALDDTELTGGPEMSDSGRFIVFKSAASDLLDPTLGVIDDNTTVDIFRHDRDPDEDGIFDEKGETATVLVSVNAAGTASASHDDVSLGASYAPSISRDGRYVAFVSTGTDLVPGVSGVHVFVRDMQTGATSLVSETTTGGTGGIEGTTPATRFATISGSGTKVAFQSDTDAGDLDPAVTDPISGSSVFGELDVFFGSPPGDISLGRGFATGLTEYLQSYRIRFDDVAPFDASYYLSGDDVFDSSDTLLGTASITDPDDLMTGGSFFAVDIGTGEGEIPFPGTASADTLEDYFILVVADPTDAVTEFDGDPFAEDNTFSVRGLYHDPSSPASPVFLHSTERRDIISATVVGESLQVTYGLPALGSDTFTYPLADVTEVRIRTHAGADSVTGSDLPEVIFGGPGSDFLDGGGGPDSLFGGSESDRLIGGDGDDFLDGGPGPDTLIGGPGDDVFLDGPGDDLVDVGLGDDEVMATPGSDDIFIDAGGIDTIDFSLDDLAITIDLDSEAVQIVDEDLNTIRLIGVWENFVGSPFDNKVTVRPLPGIPRDIRGNNGTDRLIVDADGNIVFDDGTRLTFPGTDLGIISYSEFEDIRVINAARRILDDGDTGYSANGFTRIFDEAFPQGFNGDVGFSAAGSGSSATWTFHDLPPGPYNVAASWSSAPDRATDAPYRIFDGDASGTPISQVRVNQELEPQEFQADGFSWSTLDVVTVTGHTLTVELAELTEDGDGDGDEFVIADAIRIEPLPTADLGFPIVVDDAPNRLPTGSTIETVREATGPNSVSLVGAILAFQSDLGGVDNGTTAGSQGTGRRSVDWDGVNASDATPNNLPTDYFNTTEIRGLQLNTPGVGIQVSGSTASPQGARFGNLNSDYFTDFNAFSAERLMTPIGSNVVDVTFFVPGTKTPASVSGFGAVFSDVDRPFTSKLEYFDDSGARLAERFVPATAGHGSQSFVGLTFPDASVARVRITAGGGSILGENSPNDVTKEGAHDLVVMDDFIYGEPIALPNPVESSGFSTDGLPIAGPGFRNDLHTLIGDQVARWSFSDLPAGEYLVSSTWTPGGLQAADATYTIRDGTELNAVVNQQLPPGDFMDGGISWERLGNITVTAGQPLLIDLGSPSGTPVVADSIRIDPATKVDVEHKGIEIGNGGSLSLGTTAIDAATSSANASTIINIVNSGIAPLTVHDFAVTGSGFSIDPPDGAVQIPAQASLPLQIDLTSIEVGAFNGALMFTTTDPDNESFVVNLDSTIVEDETPPTVAIRSPDHGSTFIAGTTLTIHAEAADDLGLRSVDFLVGGDEVATLTNGPYEIDLTLPTGQTSVTIQAVANSFSGVGTTSLPIIINLIPDQPPVVRITSPFDGQGIIEGSTIPITTDVSDDVGVTRVEFLVDGVVQAVSGRFDPAIAELSIDGTGDHTIQVCAHDTAGNFTCDEILVTTFPTPVIGLNSAVTGHVGDAETPSSVRVFDSSGAETFRFIPYPGFTGGVRVATGDVTGDGTPDIITGAGPGGGPHVKVFDGTTGAEFRSFLAFDGFQGGVFVAAADVNDDGIDDIITGAGQGGRPHVRVFDGRNQSELMSFLAYDSGFRGGVRVASGDITGDGIADIITGAGPGGGPHVRVFDGATQQLNGTAGVDIGGSTGNFFAYDSQFTGGVYVAAGDVNNDGYSEIITGAGAGGGPHVKVFDGTDASELSDFFAFNESFQGGVFVGAGDVNDDGVADVITGAGPGSDVSDPVRVFELDGRVARLLKELAAGQSPGTGLSVAGSSQINPGIRRPVIDGVPTVISGENATITWGDVAFVSEYEVWFSRIAPSPSRILIDSSLVASARFVLPETLDPAVYRIWVRGIGADGSRGPWSSAQSFEIRPQLVGPVTPVFDQRPEFTWNPIPFATAYQIFVRTTSGDIVETDLVGTSWTPSQDLPHGPIRWWIRATDAPGNRGWSEVGLTNVDGRSRILGPTGTGSPAAITWQTVTGAGRFVLHVLNLDTNEVVIREDNLTGTSFDVPPALPAGNYRVWVKAINAETNLFSSGFWSRHHDFLVADSDLQQPFESQLIILNAQLDSLAQSNSTTTDSQRPLRKPADGSFDWRTVAKPAVAPQAADSRKRSPVVNEQIDQVMADVASPSAKAMLFDF